MDFKYISGDIETTQAWKHPDKDLLKSWYSVFKETTGFNKYEYYVGDSLFKVDTTWDVDIFVIGEVDDYEELKNLLRQAKIAGFEHRQLIDIYWCSNLFTWEEGFQPYFKLRTWKSVKKVIDGVTKLDKEYPYEEEVIPGLYKIVNNTKPKSYTYWQEMYDKGIYENTKRRLEDVLN